MAVGDVLLMCALLGAQQALQIEHVDALSGPLQPRNERFKVLVRQPAGARHHVDDERVEDADRAGLIVRLRIFRERCGLVVQFLGGAIGQLG